tara:strand:+ start:1299 stop:2729 length:1431 start_codon:yes stop_codon:yes gene_type:complete
MKRSTSRSHTDSPNETPPVEVAAVLFILQVIVSVIAAVVIAKPEWKLYVSLCTASLLGTALFCRNKLKTLYQRWIYVSTWKGIKKRSKKRPRNKKSRRNNKNWYVTLITDPSEEIDDLKAFLNAIIKFSNNVVVNVVISGGKMKPNDRLVDLYSYLKNLGYTGDELHWVTNFQFRKEGATFKFHQDLSDASLEFETDILIVNGPMCNNTYDKVSNSMRNHSRAFVVGGLKVGGINQNGTNPAGVTNEWDLFVQNLLDKGVQITQFLPEYTRNYRFTLSDFNGDIQGIITAILTTLMMSFSRPVIPCLNISGELKDFDPGLILTDRILRANAYLANKWTKEMGLKITDNARTLAIQKTDLYMVKISENRVFSSSDNSKLSQMKKNALTCFTFAYAVAEAAYDESTEIYKDGKFGFRPEKKHDMNPDNCFLNEDMVKILMAFIEKSYKTLTPRYDVLSVDEAANVTNDGSITPIVLVW